MEGCDLKKGLLLLLVLFGLLGVGYSSYHIVGWMQDNEKTHEQIEKIQEIVEVKEKEDTASTVVVSESPYTEEKFIDVDFDSLYSINSEVAGWIQVKGTNINYPFAQHSDNRYYLKHSFYPGSNSAGWVFLDYRNSLTELSRNTIIYAHGRVDGTMFGTLKDTMSESWLSHPENYVIKVSTPFQNYLFEVFSIYHIPTTSDYLYIDFSSNQSYLNFLQKIQGRSVHSFDTEVGVTDKILTLSTCYNDQEKMVLHAKLIKTEKRY